MKNNTSTGATPNASPSVPTGEHTIIDLLDSASRLIGVLQTAFIGLEEINSGNDTTGLFEVASIIDERITAARQLIAGKEDAQ
jgi:hypothetical protein